MRGRRAARTAGGGCDARRSFDHESRVTRPIIAQAPEEIVLHMMLFI